MHREDRRRPNAAGGMSVPRWTNDLMSTRGDLLSTLLSPETAVTDVTEPLLPFHCRAWPARLIPAAPGRMGRSPGRHWSPERTRVSASRPPTTSSPRDTPPASEAETPHADAGPPISWVHGWSGPQQGRRARRRDQGHRGRRRPGRTDQQRGTPMRFSSPSEGRDSRRSRPAGRPQSRLTGAAPAATGLGVGLNEEDTARGARERRGPRAGRTRGIRPGVCCRGKGTRARRTRPVSGSQSRAQRRTPTAAH